MQARHRLNKHSFKYAHLGNLDLTKTKLKKEDVNVIPDALFTGKLPQLSSLNLESEIGQKNTSIIETRKIWYPTLET